jgi:uncharacterized protein (DUF2147 family)
MQRAVYVAMAVALVVPAWVGAADGDQIVGLWATAPDEVDGNAHVEIYQGKGKYEGKIVWLEKPVYNPDDEEGMAGQDKVDRENPDAALRDRPVLGLQIMFEFEYAGDNRWKKGTIYAPDDGKTYKCKISLSEDGVLKVRGYIGISMLGRTEEWTRVPAEQ